MITTLDNAFPAVTSKSFRGQRLLDILFAVGGLLFFGPVFLIIALAICLQDGLPVFFVQERVGRLGKSFKLLKFRSMIKNAEKDSGPVFSSKGDPRITRLGQFLRATAMDELPQLINILKGDMSVVGPRSERPVFVEQFIKDHPGYDFRHRVRPGLTGIAQVYGHYNTSARNKLRYDLLYVKEPSVGLYVKLIALSFALTLRGQWTATKKEA